MPRKFCLEICKLLFGLRKFEVIEIVERLRAFQLHMEIRNKDDGGIFLYCILCFNRVASDT